MQSKKKEARQIFYYYHENKLNKKNGESKARIDAYAKIFKEVESCSNNPEKTMDIVGLYGIEAEKEGFINGFRIAWKLIEEMNR